MLLEVSSKKPTRKGMSVCRLKKRISCGASSSKTRKLSRFRSATILFCRLRTVNKTSTRFTFWRMDCPEVKGGSAGAGAGGGAGGGGGCCGCWACRFTQYAIAAAKIAKVMRTRIGEIIGTGTKRSQPFVVQHRKLGPLRSDIRAIRRRAALGLRWLRLCADARNSSEPHAETRVPVA